MNHKFTLLTTLYNEEDPARREEYLTCISHNNTNPSIESISVFYQKDNDDDIILKELKSSGITVHFIHTRPTYRDFFNYANSYLTGKYIALCNADIYFDLDKGLNLLSDYDLTGKFFTLTRYNKLSQLGRLLEQYPNQKGAVIETREGKLRSQHLNGSSIDSWIFKAPVTIDFKCDYTLGIVSCDSNLNYQLKRSAHLRTYNPCLDIISIHEHDNWTPGKYEFITDEHNIQRTRKEWQTHNFKNGNFPATIPFCRLSETYSPKYSGGEFSNTLIQAVSHSDMVKHQYFKPNLLKDSYNYLASYPRSGNHFVRFIILSALQYRNEGTFPQDFLNLTKVPSIHSLDFQRVVPLAPTVVKTHFEYDPRYKNVIHLIRDPRDVLISYYHYIMGSNNWYMHFYKAISGPPTLEQFAGLFLDGQMWPGDIKAHTQSFSSQQNINNYLRIRYEDLVSHPMSEISRLLDFLRIGLEADDLNKIVEHTSFKNMSRLYDPESAQAATGFTNKSQLLRKGHSGGFQDEVNEEAVRRLNKGFHDYLAEYYPDLVAPI